MFGQSPFAIARGNQFERALFYRDGERLTEELIKTQVLHEGAHGFLDLRLRINGGTRLSSLDDAIAETSGLLQQLASSTKRNRAKLPVIVAGATVRIPKGVLLPEAILIIDAVAIRLDGTIPELFVGEIKSYPDRGGHTDPHELAVARAQAGIYVHALDLVVARLKIEQQVRISRNGFLVLSRPGSNQPSVRPGEDLRYQAERAKRGFDLLERAAAALSPDLWAIDDAAPPSELVDAVTHAATDYHESCVSFCELAPLCYERARQAGNAAILGDDVSRFLGAIDLNRAIALLDGAKPRNEIERDLCRRIEENDRVRGK